MTVTTTPAQLIAESRERIDAIDDRIIGLIQERMAVSTVIQDARIASGGRRVHLSREMEVLAHWSDALGKPGTALAMTLLELCAAGSEARYRALRPFRVLRLFVTRPDRDRPRRPSLVWMAAPARRGTAAPRVALRER